MPSERSIKLTIAALGGQGGGVLASWLIGIAESEGYLAQTTSVPGVAQRTGATIYYLEFFPQSLAAAAGRDPIMALMPASGDVDCVLASELAEAARAVQRGLVTRDRTTLVASSHRSYAIGERSAMGDGTADEKQLLDLVRTQAKRTVLFDMDAVAEGHHSVISSVMLGALGGSGVLPFRKAAFEAAIKKGGIAVSTNLAAFEDAYQRAERGGDDPLADSGEPSDVPTQARSPKLQPLLDRVRQLALPVRKVALEGARRAIDYQDPGYATLYLDRLERVVALDSKYGGAGEVGRGASMRDGADNVRDDNANAAASGASNVRGVGVRGREVNAINSAGDIRGGDVNATGSAGDVRSNGSAVGGAGNVCGGDRAGGDSNRDAFGEGVGDFGEVHAGAERYGQWALAEATARSLALWMTFEDTIRVADLKTRPTRFARVKDEIRAEPGQLFGITEFVKPRVQEIAGTLPAGMGRWVLRSPGVSRWLARWTGGRQVRTGTVTGFLMLHMLGGLKRWRRGTLRYHEENARIEQWLARIESLAATNYALAVELAKAQRLVKGYGETHERGWRNFCALVDKLDELALRADGAEIFARLHAAALADEEGKALARELAEISSVAVVKVALERARA
jgi:Pyruvate/2-oxoacid:ferredoxin oxidoreductase gamma subunit